MTKRASAVLLIVSLTQGTARAEPRVELETFVGGGGATPSYLTGALGGGARIGVPVGQHLVLMTGIEGQGGGQDDYTAYWIRIPAELKVYLTRPRPGGLSPQLRLGAAYTRSGFEMGRDSSKGNGIEGLGGLGVSYLVSEHFGLGVDVGLSYGRYRTESDAVGFVGGMASGSEGWQLGLSWRLGLVFRI